MTEGRVTQAPVEALERFDTAVRLTQAAVEALERFDTNIRLTQAPIEVLWSGTLPCQEPDPDYVDPTLGPDAGPLGEGKADTSAPKMGHANRASYEAPRVGSAISSAPRKGSARSDS